MQVDNDSGNPPVGDASGAGGAGASGSQDGGAGGAGSGGGGDDPPKHVPYDSHRKLLDEKKRAQARIDELEREKREREVKDAEANGDLKKLLELEREAKAKAEAKLAAQEQVNTARRKLAAILDGVGGHVDRKWYRTLEAAGLIDQVIVDPTTGEVDGTSVAKVVGQIRQSFPEIVQAKGPRTSSADPAAGGAAPAGKIRHSEYVKLPYAEMKKWRVDQIVDD